MAITRPDKEYDTDSDDNNSCNEEPATPNPATSCFFAAVYGYLKICITPPMPDDMLDGINNILKKYYEVFLPQEGSFEQIIPRNKLFSSQALDLQEFIASHFDQIDDIFDQSHPPIPPLPKVPKALPKELDDESLYKDKKIPFMYNRWIQDVRQLSTIQLSAIIFLFCEHKNEEVASFNHLMRIHIWQLFLRLTKPHCEANNNLAPTNAEKHKKIYQYFIASLLIATKIQFDEDIRLQDFVTLFNFGWHEIKFDATSLLKLELEALAKLDFNCNVKLKQKDGNKDKEKKDQEDSKEEVEHTNEWQNEDKQRQQAFINRAFDIMAFGTQSNLLLFNDKLDNQSKEEINTALKEYIQDEGKRLNGEDTVKTTTPEPKQPPVTKR